MQVGNTCCRKQTDKHRAQGRGRGKKLKGRKFRVSRKSRTGHSSTGPDAPPQQPRRSTTNDNDGARRKQRRRKRGRPQSSLEQLKTFTFHYQDSYCTIFPFR